MKKLTPNKKRGAALVEYGLLIAGVALICAAAVSLFGKKTNDLVGTVAAVLPSSSAEDVGAIAGGRVILTQEGAINWTDVLDGEKNTTDDLFGDGASGLITDLQNSGD